MDEEIKTGNNKKDSRQKKSGGIKKGLLLTAMSLSVLAGGIAFEKSYGITNSISDAYNHAGNKLYHAINEDPREAGRDFLASLSKMKSRGELHNYVDDISKVITNANVYRANNLKNKEAVKQILSNDFDGLKESIGYMVDNTGTAQVKIIATETFERITSDIKSELMNKTITDFSLEPDDNQTIVEFAFNAYSNLPTDKKVQFMKANLQDTDIIHKTLLDLSTDYDNNSINMIVDNAYSNLPTDKKVQFLKTNLQDLDYSTSNSGSFTPIVEAVYKQMEYEEQKEFVAAKTDVMKSDKGLMGKIVSTLNSYRSNDLKNGEAVKQILSNEDSGFNESIDGLIGNSSDHQKKIIVDKSYESLSQGSKQNFLTEKARGEFKNLYERLKQKYTTGIDTGRHLLELYVGS